ncbi:diacylglycerol kinase family protein [Kutzneria viridogrisea]|uniref:Diacylglycerol kinase family enzyme n=1 Tax=Kutzneria viridogrisea TaxID=47990 RepID=A0ABR6BHW2_9PSEU|nr:diacylglycerol kinase family enzyme [Kutzneria viridogrisea]
MRALLVVNPQATATTAAGRDVLAHALASSVKLDIVETDHRGHARKAASGAAAEGVDLVVAHGGDGTVNEVVNGLLDSTDGGPPPVLGVVPGGSANVFARALGLPRDPVEATHRLLMAIETGSRREVGLGRVEPVGTPGRWFTFNAGLGWDADVVAEVERRRDKQASPLLYATIALTSYFRQMREAPQLRVELPGGELVHDVRLAFVSNTDPWTYLGGKPISINPETSFDGGLGLFALRSLGPTTVARTLSQILLPKFEPSGGNLVRRDDVDYLRVSSSQPVRLQVDGDDLGEHSQVGFSSVPAALRVAV